MLGAVHLPRLWQKALLSAKGMLPEDYDECGKGFDQMTLNGLGLDREKTLAYLKSELPTYPSSSAGCWSRTGATSRPTGSPPTTPAIAGYMHGDSTRQAILSDCGLQDDGTIKDAVTLNKLEDFNEFHRRLASA